MAKHNLYVDDNIEHIITQLRGQLLVKAGKDASFKDIANTLMLLGAEALAEIYTDSGSIHDKVDSTLATLDGLKDKIEWQQVFNKPDNED